MVVLVGREGSGVIGKVDGGLLLPAPVGVGLLGGGVTITKVRVRVGAAELIMMGWVGAGVGGLVVVGGIVVGCGVGS